jgi:hypothetical protein
MDKHILIIQGLTYDTLHSQMVQGEYFDGPLIGNTISQYDKLPDTFSLKDPWPRSSNCQCMHCGCVTNRIPLFIPQALRKEVGPEGSFLRYRVGGTVCSFNCAVAEVRYSESTESLRDNKMTMIWSLARTITGKEVISIVPAGPKSQLTRYGGKVEDFDYQERLLSLVDFAPLLLASNNKRLCFTEPY